MNRVHGAFIHARYSTDNQNPDTIEVQVQKCAAWCNQNSIPVLGVFSDEATSGMKDTRPQYEAMISQLQMGLADTVVIYDQSRMFRKMTAWFFFRDRMAALGVTVVSVTQPSIGKDLRDPMNFVTEGSMALFNQMHALITRQKVMEKMRFMARNGQHTGGKPPLGYCVRDGKLDICEEEAATVRRIFSEYAAGMSYREIIEGLNRDGLKTRNGKTFGSNSLHDLLKNEKYIGTLIYGASPYREDGTRNTHLKDGTDVVRIEDAIPSIIEKELFQKVQEKMAVNKHQQGGRPPKKRDYPLKGKVFCADCKSAMTVATSQKIYDYYRCSGKKRKHDCDSAPISVNELEEIVLEMVRSLFLDPVNFDSLLEILTEQRSAIQAGAVATMQSIVAERAAIVKKLENAADAVLAGLSSSTILSKIQELETRKSTLDAQAASLKASVEASLAPKEALREYVRSLVEGGYDSKALLSLVSRVEVGKDVITVWTIIDTDPVGDIDYSQTGIECHLDSKLTNTLGIASGVPIVFITSQFIRMSMKRKKSAS